VRWDRIAMVDWSGGNQGTVRPRADAIWIGVDGEASRYQRHRGLAEAWLTDWIEERLIGNERALIGFDFPFGYPHGFARSVTGSDATFNLWAWFAERIQDAPMSNNRFDVAAAINRKIDQLPGPFWGNALQRDIDGLSRNMQGYRNPFAERRACEERAGGTFTCWQLAGAGAVGSQVLMGLPVLHRLRSRFPGNIAVWPFEPLDAPIAFVEIWPGLINPQVNEETGAYCGIRDASQMRLMANALRALDRDTLKRMLDKDAPEEGWILGLGHEDALRAAAASSLVQHPTLPRPATPLTPPRLANDCFALPPGVDWTPVDDALARLRDALHPVVGFETVPLAAALGRVLAAPQTARRANPPGANAAVDGFGFAHASIGEGAVTLPLAEGRAAAGAPFPGNVPPGQALRILTGALLPEGVDTVVLEEDTSTDGAAIAFEARIKRGANTRRAGEDVEAGDEILPAGRRLRPPDLALLAATGRPDVPVFRPLRIAVLSTGDELVSPGMTDDPARTYDANRPMLLALARAWGAEPVDLGHAPDRRPAVRAALDEGSARADLILTSGGASAGDEDHVSALLKTEANLTSWRIALKPGRPLALAVWNGVPVMGLPGNPVAALVCALVFGRPAVGVLSGEGWREPLAFTVPAAFEKRKKPGRREFLRARLDAGGRAEVFASEGSGRISGLSWAEGLVELPDGAGHVRPGDPVRYLPYAGFGL